LAVAAFFAVAMLYSLIKLQRALDHVECGTSDSTPGPWSIQGVSGEEWGSKSRSELHEHGWRNLRIRTA
jgi:hypothetical protein